MWFSSTIVPLLVGATACIPAVSSNIVHYSASYSLKDAHSAPTHWKRRERAPLDDTIVVQIGLEHSAFDELERRLYQGNELLDCTISILLLVYASLNKHSLRPGQ
jgi:hypothetical protein